MVPELMKMSEDFTEFLHNTSTMMILQINGQQVITYCNNGFLKLFSLTRIPTGAGLVDFLLPGPKGVIYDTGIQEFVCNPRTNRHGIVEVHKSLDTSGLLSLWCDRPSIAGNRPANQTISPSNRPKGVNLII